MGHAKTMSSHPCTPAANMQKISLYKFLLVRGGTVPWMKPTTGLQPEGSLSANSGEMPIP
jgi:hypothetical protein